MKKYAYVYLSLFLILGCEPKEISCDEGIGESFEVSNQPADFRYDKRFDEYVLSHHVEGSIDAFRTFLICNLPKEWNGKENQPVEFSGSARALKEKYKPNTLIAGEEFFVLSLNNMNAQERE